MVNNIIRVADKDIFVEVPVKFGRETRFAKINWIQLLEEPFFVAGLTLIGENSEDNYKDANTEWVLQKTDNSALKPICCNLYW